MDRSGMKVVILVPRRRDNEWRDKLWAFCRQRWVEHHDPMPIYEGHHEMGPFNRSAAVNAASELADRDGRWDVALIIDSDTISDSKAVQAAIEYAVRTGGLAVAHDQRHMMSQHATIAILDGYVGSWKRNRMVRRTYTDSVSCAVAVARQTWDLVGGFDERFVGWGFEDTGFHIACETMTGIPIHNVPGECFHLWHPLSPEASKDAITYELNRSLKRRYEAVRWNKERLQRLLGTSDEQAVGTIPRILHRTVPEVTSSQVEGWWQRFEELHPDWDLRTYREPIDPIDWPMTGDLFARCQNGAQKAGLIRLEAIFTHGGVYVDSDVEPYRPLDSLLQCKAFAAWEDEKVVPDAVMGAIAEHPAWLELIGRAREAIEGGQDAWASGPGGTTELLPGREDVLLLPPGAFYPAHYLEKARLGQSGAKPWVFMEHKWHHSWGTPAQHAANQRRQRVRQEPEPEPEKPNLRIALCMPWNNPEDRWRRDAHEWCVRWWKLSDLPIFEGVGDSRSAMCNDAAKWAGNADVLIFVDADTWVPHAQIYEAARVAHETGRMTHAFTTYTRLSSSLTRQTQKRHVEKVSAVQLAKTNRRHRSHVSGANAVPLALWQRLGGYDERFTEWGHEDRAFDLAAGCLGGGINRVEGPALHWYHPPVDGKLMRPTMDDPATQLVIRYAQAAGRVPDAGRALIHAVHRVPTDAQPDVEAMLAILREDGGPLASAISYPAGAVSPREASLGPL